MVLKCVLNHFSDMHGPIWFKLGTSTVHDGIHMHLILSCDLIKDGGVVDWWPFCYLNVSSTISQTCMFKLGTSTVHDGIHMHLTLFCDFIKDGRLVDWQPFLLQLIWASPLTPYNKITKTMMIFISFFLV